LAFKYVFSKEEKNEEELEGDVSSFAALCTALSSTIGTGNIVGVGLAITVGGAGAIFWMWISAFFGMMTVFAEIALSAKYAGKSRGAFSYIEKIGKGKILPFVYGIGCVLSSLAMGNMAQANSVAAAVSAVGVPNWLSGVVLAILLFMIAGKGIRGVAGVTEKLVPLMTLLFFGFSLVCLWRFRVNIPGAVGEIFEGAFSLRGGLGGAMFLAMKTGISRGVFTNEAGLGSSSMAFSNVRGKSPEELGYLGIFQVFLDTTVMCTLTGLCVLCCTDQREGEFLVRAAFQNAMGNWGAGGMNLCMGLFAFATMTATCYYGQVGLNYISKNRLSGLFPYLFAGAAFLGCVLPLGQVFVFCDAFNGLMAIPNILSLAYFSKEIFVIIHKT
ncbi:MAG: amino acid carrier protein, partial [Oscillospiraceae bacterium]